MQNEKQNKHIQQTVGELQQLPNGFAFNSQKVWISLEQQLPVKKITRTTWYYAAAAILLVAGTAYLTMRTGNTSQFTDKKLTAGLPVPGKQKTVVAPIHKTNDQPALVSTLPPAVKKQVVQAVATKLSGEKKTNKIETVPAPQIIVPAEQIVAEAPLAEQVNKEEKRKLPAVTLTKPAPKKYKVIHLNELMQSTIPDPQNMLSKSEFKKMMQQNEEKETAAPAENNTKQLFFFKIKPATTTNTISIVEN